MAVAPSAKARKAIESMTSVKAAAWVDISMPRAPPFIVTLPMETEPLLPEPRTSARPAGPPRRVLVATVKLTAPPIKASALPVVWVATSTEPPMTVPLEAEM